MEFAAAVIGVVEATTRVSSALWKLSEQWKNAPRDVHGLRDEVDRVCKLYKMVKAHVEEGGPSSPKFDIANELAALMQEGLLVVNNLQQLLDRLGPQPTRTDPDGGRALSDCMHPATKRRRLLWLRNSHRVRYLKSALQKNVEQIGLHLVLLNLSVTADIPSRISEVGDEVTEQILSALDVCATSPLTDTSDSFSETTLVPSMSDMHFYDTEESPVYPPNQETMGSCLTERVAESKLSQRSMRNPNANLTPAFADMLVAQDFGATRRRLIPGLQMLVGSKLEQDESALAQDNTLDGDPWAEFIKETAGTDKLVRACDSFCSCTCHFVQSYGHWSMTAFHNFVGALHVAFTGFSLLRTPHSDPTCLNRKESRTLKLNYSFPNWLLAGSLSIFYAKMANQGPELVLRVRYHVLQDSQLSEDSKENIFWAIIKNDLPEVKRIVTQRPGAVNGDAMNPGFGRSAIHFAIVMTRIPMIKFLLQAGADIYQPDDHGLEPVASAFESFCIDPSSAASRGIRDLIPFGKHLEEEGYSDLHKVVAGILPLRLDEALRAPRFRAQLNSDTRMGYTPLHMTRDAAPITALLAAGADPNRRTKNGKTPLILVCRACGLDAAAALLGGGADPNATCQSGITPLISAVQSLYWKPAADPVPLLRLLVERGANPDGPGVPVPGPLQTAVSLGHVGCVRFLLEAGADVNRTDSSNETPLWEAICSRSLVMAKVLLDVGADYRVINTNRFNVLHVLASRGTPALMDEFAGRHMRGVDPLLKDTWNRTPRGLLDCRKDLMPELVQAFERLMASVGPGLFGTWLPTSFEDEEGVGDSENFFDAVEHQPA